MLATTSFAQTEAIGAASAQTRKGLEEIYAKYNQGHYEEALAGLEQISLDRQPELAGLLEYWKGLCLLRLNEFEQGLSRLEKAHGLGFEAPGIFYEMGQAQYVSLKLREARNSFRKSIEQRHKMAASMYYIASISEELNDHKTAASFYSGIERLPASEKEEVVQAARMRLGDIYLAQVRKQGNDLTAIEKYVLPQYRKALAWDRESALAAEIAAKIENIERRYDLTLFKLRNGRPAARPRHFLKANVAYGMDDNVNLLGEKAIKELAKDEVGASSIAFGAYGRYTFYPNTSFGITPQINFQRTIYQSDKPIITQNNNYMATATLQTAYEGIFNEAPATTYLNLDYTYLADDLDQDDKLERAAVITGATLSQELQFLPGNPSIFRLSYSKSESPEEGADYTAMGAVYEQILALGNTVLYFYSQYEQNRHPEFGPNDNEKTTIRLDVLLPDFKGLFNTNLYASMRKTDYTENPDRQTANMNSFGVNFNRPFGRNYYAYLDLSWSKQTGDEELDEYAQQLVSFNLDYIF